MSSGGWAAGVTRSVGIGVPVYNEHGHIAETVASALEQDHRTVTVVVSDNGSTDGTPDVVRAVAAEHPSRVCEVVEQPRGLGLAGNFRWLRDEVAPRHDHFVWLGAHDRLPVDYVRRLVATFSEREGVSLACPGTVHWRHGPSPEGTWREETERLVDLSDAAFGGDKFLQLLAMVGTLESCTELHGVWASEAVLAVPCLPLWAWDHVAIFTAACLGVVVTVPDVVYVRRETFEPEPRREAERRRAAAGMAHGRRAFLRWVRLHRRAVRRCRVLDRRERVLLAIAVTAVAWRRFGGWTFRSSKRWRPLFARIERACVERARPGAMSPDLGRAVAPDQPGA